MELLLGGTAAKALLFGFFRLGADPGQLALGLGFGPGRVCLEPGGVGERLHRAKRLHLFRGAEGADVECVGGLSGAQEGLRELELKAQRADGDDVFVVEGMDHALGDLDTIDHRPVRAEIDDRVIGPFGINLGVDS